MSLSQTIRNAVSKSFVDFQGLATASIEAFYEDDLTADIQIKKNSITSDGVITYIKALKIPICILSGGGYAIRGTFEKDDIVLVAFAVSEIDTSGKETGDTSKFLSKDNCVIVGGLVTANPSTDGKLFVGSDTNNIQLSDSQILLTVGAVSFKIDATGAHITVGGVTFNIFTHLHGTGVGPSTSPTPNT